MDENQKWTWGYVNTTALENWESFGVKIPLKQNYYLEFRYFLTQAKPKLNPSLTQV